MDGADDAQSVLLHREQAAFPETERLHPKQDGKRGGAVQTRSAPTAQLEIVEIQRHRLRPRHRLDVTMKVI